MVSCEETSENVLVYNSIQKSPCYMPKMIIGKITKNIQTENVWTKYE